jgi:predicted transcriptional regulator
MVFLSLKQDVFAPLYFYENAVLTLLEIIRAHKPATLGEIAENLSRWALAP